MPKKESALPEAKKALLQPDDDGCYMGLIDAGYTEDDTPSPADISEARKRLGALFDAAKQVGHPITKADLLHLDRHHEPFITFEEGLRHFSWLTAKLKETTGESFTVAELGSTKFGDGSAEHKKMTILESAGEETLLGEIFNPENWQDRAEDCVKLHQLIPEIFKNQVNLDGVLARIREKKFEEKLKLTKPLTGEAGLTKKQLFATDSDGFSPFDHPDNLAGLLTLNENLTKNGQGHITFEELAKHHVQSGDSVLTRIVETSGIGALIGLSIATGEALPPGHLTVRGIGKNAKHALEKTIERGELATLFPVPEEGKPETLIWVHRPKEMVSLWNQVSSAQKRQLANPDFNARLNLVNGMSLVGKSAGATLEF